MSSIHTLDHRHIWHPAAQMKDYLDFKPIVIEKAHGCFLFTNDGRRIIDAVASWWCKSLGHNHPRLKQALLRQLEQFEHVILANTTNATIVRLGEALASLSPQLTRSFFASDGSCAVEIAMKMSLHAHQIQGESQRTRFITLENGYHGETAAALSVSDVGLYRNPYRALLFDPVVLTGLPYRKGENDPQWRQCQQEWAQILPQLEPYKETATAVIVEPVVQGAGGMKMYSPALLAYLRQWCHQQGVHLIADEIMTGIGRTGKMLAVQHADVEADFVCLSKGLTSGFLPLSVVLTHEGIYQTFYDDYETGKAFLHSHTFSGNALAAAVALEVLAIMHEQAIAEQACTLGRQMLLAMQGIADRTQLLCKVRSVGAIVAADLVNTQGIERAGYKVYQQAVARGALLRNLGDTLYWLPPLTMTEDTLQELATITEEALVAGMSS